MQSRQNLSTNRISLLHVALYSTLLVLYSFLVLHFLSGWLEHLFHVHRYGYATAAILLMIAQSIGLELISHGIIKLVRRGEK